MYCKACLRPIKVEKRKYNMTQRNKTEQHMNNMKNFMPNYKMVNRMLEDYRSHEDKL